MPPCMLCNNNATSAVCASCQHLTGVREMPPARRRTAPCARCNHAKLIRVIPRELSVQASRTEQRETEPVAIYAPMTATYPVKITRDSPYSDEYIAPPTPLDGLGVFECYICKRCGFVDWFCQDPENIPIGPKYMTEEIDSDGDAPFR